MEKKKNDLKTLAMMGLTGGLLLSAGELGANEADQAEFFTNNAEKYSSYFAGGSSCSSSGHGCQNVTPPAGGNVSQPGPNNNSTQPQEGGNLNQSAPSGTPTQPMLGGGCGAPRNNGYYSQNRQGGCGAPRNNGYYTQNRQNGCGAQARNNNGYYTQNQPQSGCGNYQPARNYYTQRQNGCGAQQRNNGYYTQNQPQSGCGNHQPSRNYAQGCGAQRSAQRYADNTSDSLNSGANQERQGQHINRPNAPRGYAENETQWDDNNKNTNNTLPQTQRSNGYVAESDPMGDGTKRMEQRANQMNPQAPKTMQTPRNN